MTTPGRSAPFQTSRRLFLATGSWLSRHAYPPPWLPPCWQHPAIGYLAALLLALLAGALTVLLTMILPSFTFLEALLVLVVVVVALNWGQGPSLLATLTGALLLASVINPPYDAWDVDDRTDFVNLGLFLLAGGTVSLVASQTGWARRKAEQLALEAEVARQEAEQARQRLQQVLDVLPVGVFIAGATGEVLEANPATRVIWGKDPPLVREIAQYGTYQGWWPGTGKHLTPEEWPLARAILYGEVSLGEEIDIEAFDGQRKMILSFAVPIRAETGQITGAVVALLDISERKQMEEALRAAKTQMDTFLGIASHELHTPLTSLKLQLGLTMRRLQRLICAEAAETIGRPELLLPVQESMSRMKLHLGRLERLVNDLLEMSRIQAGKLDLLLEQFDLATLIRHVVEEQQEISSRTIVLRLPGDQPVRLIADIHRIEQVLTNYLTNALKYSPDERSVDMGLEVEKGQVRVWVRDAGPGIPAEEQAYIWERFHRVAGIEVQSGSGVGLGLGLSISREIVERHHGRVGVESAPGFGSTFWFTLPLATQEADGDP